MKKWTIISGLFLLAAINLDNLDTLNANELSPPKIYDRLAPDFLQIPLKSSYSLPSVKSETSPDKNKSKNKITVKKVQLKGNTTLKKALVRPIIQKIMNNKVSIGDLEQVRYDISKLYYDAGFINSGVVLPKQSYEKGIVVFVAIEGVLTDVNITGLSKVDEERMRNTIIQQAGTPLNIHKLQASLNRINSLRTIDKLHATFLPGTRPGESVLDIKISEARHYNFILGVDNYRSPSVGSERGFIAFQHYNVTGHSDSLSLQTGLAAGVKDYSLRYDIPVNIMNSRVSGYYVKSDSQFIEDTQIANLDISNSTSIYGANWSFRLIENTLLLRDVGIGIEYLKNKNSIIGLDEENVFIITSHQQFDAVKIQHGIDATIRVGKTSTKSEDGVINRDSSFSLVKLKTSSVKKLPAQHSTINIKTSSQFLSKSLLGLERFSIGGYHSVRGYRENTLVRDNGIILNLEYITPLTIPFLTATAFVDAATGWDNKGSANNQRLFSLGGGLTWNNHKNLNIDSYVGLPLMNKLDKSGNLQDLGIHLGFQYRL